MIVNVGGVRPAFPPVSPGKFRSGPLQPDPQAVPARPHPSVEITSHCSVNAPMAGPEHEKVSICYAENGLHSDDVFERV